jgi:DNA polymerase/3'-5' exonuclease PolX
VKKGLKINEYGVFEGEKRVAGRTEEEVHQQVGFPYIEPEQRRSLVLIDEEVIQLAQWACDIRAIKRVRRRWDSGM